MNKWLVLGIAAILLVGGLIAWPSLRPWLQRANPGEQPTTGYGHATVSFTEISVDAQIPRSAELQAKGLAGRTALGADEGMLWRYERAEIYTFWMKGMLIPIDFIWIRDGRVVDITPQVQPPTGNETRLPVYRPSQPVTEILEVQSGFVASHGIRIGDTVDIR